MKTFNTAGACVPSRHYMVDLSDKVQKIREMVEEGQYFIVSKPMQYGKTTVLAALKKSLEDTYPVLFLDLEEIGSSGYVSEECFVREFCRLVWNCMSTDGKWPDSVPGEIRQWKDDAQSAARLGQLMDTLNAWCASLPREMVLIMDEADGAYAHPVFQDFLAHLRAACLSRDTAGRKTFHLCG